MLRITNAMITRNTKNNINSNKTDADAKNTMVATGQKISRPSDDPVIAIRALRLNTNLTELNQYYDKNIPDAEAWLKVTETALVQTDSIFTSLKEDLTTGASDDNTISDRQKILNSLTALRDQIYSSGNADYAGRTVFTGYRTGEPLTFLATDSEVVNSASSSDADKTNYHIHETFDSMDVEKFTYVTSGVTAADVTANDVYRVRLSYNELNAADGDTMEINLPGGSTISVTVKSINGLTDAQKDAVYTTVPADEAYLIPETGELILGKDAATALNGINGKKGDNATFAYIEYDKNTWKSNDLRPEHYFACYKTNPDPEPNEPNPMYYNYDPDTAQPDFENKDVNIEISFNQYITINTNASDVYSHGIGRDMDELILVTQDAIYAEERLNDIKKQYDAETDEAVKASLKVTLDAADKEYSLKKEKMQKTFSNAITRFDGYSDQVNLAISNVGSISKRLSITKERVGDQLQSFKELADSNINVNLTDSAIDLESANLALQAAQMSAAKISQQTLLNYL